MATEPSIRTFFVCTHFMLCKFRTKSGGGRLFNGGKFEYTTWFPHRKFTHGIGLTKISFWELLVLRAPLELNS